MPARSRHRREEPLPTCSASPTPSTPNAGAPRSRHRRETTPAGHRPLIWLAGSAAAVSLCAGIFVPLWGQTSAGADAAASAPDVLARVLGVGGLVVGVVGPVLAITARRKHSA